MKKGQWTSGEDKLSTAKYLSREQKRKQREHRLPQEGVPLWLSSQQLTVLRSLIEAGEADSLSDAIELALARKII